MLCGEHEDDGVFLVVDSQMQLLMAPAAANGLALLKLAVVEGFCRGELEEEGALMVLRIAVVLVVRPFSRPQVHKLNGKVRTVGHMCE